MTESTAFWTVSNNFVMGNGSNLPWEQSERVVSLFREIAKGKILIYGSTTAISGVLRKSLNESEFSEEDAPIHIALSSTPEKIPKDYVPMGGHPLDILAEIANKYPGKGIVFVGGMNIISQFLGYCHNFYINVLDMNAQGTLVFTEALFDYLRRTSAIISKNVIPEIPTYPQIEMYHFKRSIH